MRQAEGAHRSIALPNMRRDLHEAMAQAAFADGRAAVEEQRASDGAELLAAREAAPKALPALRRVQDRAPPSRLCAAAPCDLALPSVPPEAAREQAPPRPSSRETTAQGLERADRAAEMVGEPVLREQARSAVASVIRSSSTRGSLPPRPRGDRD